MNRISEILRFWNRNPALLYGILSLLGFYGSFYGLERVCIPLLLLLLPYLIGLRNKTYWKPLSMGFLILVSSWIYGSVYHRPVLLPEEGVQGEAYIAIESISEQSSHFGKNWVYRCHLHDFFSVDGGFSGLRNVKCKISLPQQSGLMRPAADKAYLVKGRLLPPPHGHYFFKVDKKEDWLSVKGSWSFSEVRYRSKQCVMKWFESLYSHARSAVFLSGLLTGEFDDRMMQSEFARFGLQHIMAISGFHFAIVASILALILRFAVPSSAVTVCVFICLTAYFVFLGNSASILRAWLMITITLSGEYFGKKGSALNSLGVALLVILPLDPLLSQTVGFQFSFLATAAILLCFAPFNYFLESLFPKRPLSQMKEMNGWNRHGYCLLVFFRQGLALAMAINVFVIPLTLYYFHRFSYMSLLYNFFFPLFVSLSVFLLLIGLVFSLLFPPIGTAIHFVNNSYTNRILDLIYNLPSSVDRYFEIEEISLGIVSVHASLIFIFGIYMKSELLKRREESSEFLFI